MNEIDNNQDPEQELTFDERFKLAVERWRPYLLLLWETRWKFVKINALVMVFTLIYLLFLIKPYYEITGEV